MNLCSIFTSAFQTLSTLSRQSSMNKYYRLARATSLSHIWLNLGLSIRLRSLFLNPAQISFHAAPQTECILCIYFCTFPDEYVCMWCFLSTCVFIQCPYCTFRSALVSVQSVTWQLERKILMCLNISTQPQGFKCKGLCKWIGVCFLSLVHLKMHKHSIACKPHHIWGHMLDG